MRVMHIKMVHGAQVIQEGDDVLLTNVHAVMYDRLSAVAKQTLQSVAPKKRKKIVDKDGGASHKITKFLQSVSLPLQIRGSDLIHSDKLTAAGKKMHQEFGFKIKTLMSVLNNISRKHPDIVSKPAFGLYMIHRAPTYNEVTKSHTVNK